MAFIMLVSAAVPRAQQGRLHALQLLRAPCSRCRLQFVVVSEPLPGTGGECEDLGIAYVDLREILWTGNDVLEHDLDGEQL